MRGKRRSLGFTLIEMIVATFLLAVGIAGAVSAFSMATRASSVADGIHTAVLLGQKKMTEIELQGSSLTGGSTQGDFGSDYPGYQFSQSIEGTEYDNLFKVTVTIQWGGVRSPQQRVFTTYLRNDMNQQASSSSTGGTSGTSSTGGTNSAK